MNCNEVQRGLSEPSVSVRMQLRGSSLEWEALAQSCLTSRTYAALLRILWGVGTRTLSAIIVTSLPAALSPADIDIPTPPPRRGTLSQSLRGSQGLCERNPPKGKAGKMSHKQLTGVFWKLVFKRPPFPSHSICSLTLPFTPRISCSCSLPQNFSKRKRHSYFLLRKSRKLVWTWGWLRQPREGKLINCCIT